MKKLGFKLSRVQKGVYVDGHERPDVVEARKKFINYMETYVFPYVLYMLDLYLFIDVANIRFCYKYEGDNMETAVPPNLKPGEKIHYPIFHDKCCIQANDQCTYVWMREGEQPLRDKSRGQIVHVSDFIVEHSG